MRYRVDGKARSRTFDCSRGDTRKSDAFNFLKSVEGDAVAGTLTDPKRGRQTLASWAEEWLPRKKRLQPSSYARLEQIIKRHIKEKKIGRRPLAKVTHALVQDWIDEMEDVEELRPATIKKNVQTLNQIMGAAAAPGERRIPFNPCEGVEPPPADVREQRFLTISEIDALAAAMESIEPRFRALGVRAPYSGLRWGELAGLRRRHIDFLRGRVTVAESLHEVNGKLFFGPPKTKNSVRNVPLPGAVLREMERHLDEFVDASPDALVFTGPTTKEGVEPVMLRRAGFRRRW